MVKSRFDLREVRNLGFNRTQAKIPHDLAVIQSRLSTNLYGISAIVSLSINELGDTMYLPIPFPNSLYEDYITSYFQHRYLYIIRHELIQLPRLAIDYTITFDTNSASYVSSIVKNRSFAELRPEVITAFNKMLNNHFNFDSIFYFIENIKLAIPIIQNIRKTLRDTPLKFWKLLDRNFRWNIICLEIFKGIDTRYYSNTQKFKFDDSFIQAARKSVDFAYNFYASYTNRHLIQEFLQYQRLLLFQLLEIYKIQFSTRKNAKNKLELFLSFVQNECPVFLGRETFLAYEYFKNRNNVSILNKINKSGDQTNLWEKVNNVAWDLTAIRNLERMFLARGQADYMIPFFLTFDKNLRDFIKSFPTKAVLIDRLSEGVGIVTIPSIEIKKYFEDEGCGVVFNTFSSEEKTRERFSKIRKKPNISPNQVKAKYKELKQLLEH